MATLTIRNVPDWMHESLCRKARVSGMSLQAYLLDELARVAALPSRKEWVAEVEASLRRSPSFVSMDEILAAIDEGRAEADGD